MKSAEEQRLIDARIAEIKRKEQLIKKRQQVSTWMSSFVTWSGKEFIAHTSIQLIDAESAEK